MVADFVCSRFGVLAVTGGGKRPDLITLSVLVAPLGFEPRLYRF